MSGPNQPKQPSGASKDKQLDLEQDALLDSLLFDELPAPAPPAEPTPIKLHQPLKREFSEDDVTVVGRTEDLLASLSQYEDDGTSGLEDLASSDASSSSCASWCVKIRVRSSSSSGGAATRGATRFGSLGETGAACGACGLNAGGKG